MYNSREEKGKLYIYIIIHFYTKFCNFCTTFSLEISLFSQASPDMGWEIEVPSSSTWTRSPQIGLAPNSILQWGFGKETTYWSLHGLLFTFFQFVNHTLYILLFTFHLCPDSYLMVNEVTPGIWTFGSITSCSEYFLRVTVLYEILNVSHFTRPYGLQSVIQSVDFFSRLRLLLVNCEPCRAEN